MITISKINFLEKNGMERIETQLDTDGKIFNAYIEITKGYGKYFVTDRADAFLVGILIKAMVDGHDIKCELPISSELKFLLEHQLIHTLAKHDENFHIPKIIADTTDTPIKSEGAVGTGISLGLDSFCTIMETYNLNCDSLRLTHLFTFNNGVYGGYYQNNNWGYCAKQLYDREKVVAEELGLPLVSMNTNVTTFVSLRADYWQTYHHIMMIMSVAKLVSAYFISSDGEDFSQFKVDNTCRHDCATYDLLTLYSCSLQNGVRFLSGGGEKDRVEKIKLIAQYPVARNNLQSCLTEYYNCMICQKCKRNLVTLDALGILDDFNKVYDIPYYRKNRGKYISWMCDQIRMDNHASNYIKPAYDLIKAREPELIERYEMPMDKVLSERTELRRQRNVYRNYTIMFRRLMSTPNWNEKLKQWFEDRKIKRVIIYGYSEATKILWAIRNQLGIEIAYIVQNVKAGEKTAVPRLPENTINYPNCDAIIICNADAPELIHKKLKGLVNCSIYEISQVMGLK